MSKIITCPRCRGTGTVRETASGTPHIAGITEKKTCPNCNGTGKVRV